jgi:hypothetical protein
MSPAVASLETPKFSPKFKFQSFWVQLPGFLEVVRYVRNSNMRHGSKMRAKAIVSNLEK